MNNSTLQIYFFICSFLLKKKKKSWKVLPLYNVFGRSFVERILASRLLPCLSFPFSLPAATSESYHLLTARTQIKPQFGFVQTKDTSSLVWTTGNFRCKVLEFRFGSNRRGETKQIRCGSKWTDLPHIWINCVNIWDFLVILTILITLDEYLAINLTLKTL